MARTNKTTRKTLIDNKLAPKKRFGQNFLVHKHTAEAIVKAGSIDEIDTVIEVGVGLGALTVPLASEAKRVIGFEIDSGIVRYHQEQQDLPENVTLIHKDILKADFTEVAKECGGKMIVMANLPYSISNPFIFKLIDNAEVMDRAVIMLQKEVADRLMAQPRTKDYGVPTVLLGSCASVRKLLNLPPEEFHPRPKVDSVVINIDFAGFKPAAGSFPEYNKSLLKNIVRTTFNQRRKTILNTLSNLVVSGGEPPFFRDKPKSQLEECIIKARLKPSARPETLSTGEFISLAVELDRLISTSDY